MRALGIAAGVAVALVLAAAVVSHRPAEPPGPGAAPAASCAEGGGPSALPASLRGTTADGSYALDAAGRFVPTRSALARFQWFLSATGEEADAALRERIVRDIQASLSGDAAAQAEAFLDQFLAYRESMRELAAGGAVPHELARRLQWFREQRRAHFGAGLAAELFGEEEMVAMLDLERREVVRDASLSDAEREERLTALDAGLPETVRASRADASLPARVSREVEALRASGASESQVFSVRERAFGADAAERLAALDEKRALWHERLDGWRAEREAIAADASLSPDEREAAIDAARGARFSPDELARVAALDEVAAVEKSRALAR